MGFDDTKWALVDIGTELKPTGADKLGLAVERLKSVAGTMSATASTAGVAAEKLGPAVNTFESAVETLGTQALIAGGAASWRGKFLTSKAPAFVEDTSYSIRLTDIDKFETEILMRHKADEQRREGDVADKNLRELFISNQFKPTFDKVREDKRKPTSEQQEAMEEQTSLEEQPEPIEEQILPRRGRRSSTVDKFE